jgi:hypothetical protein
LKDFTSVKIVSPEISNIQDKREIFAKKESSILTLADVSFDQSTQDFEDSDLLLVKEIFEKSNSESYFKHVDGSIDSKNESLVKGTMDSWIQVTPGKTHSVATETDTEHSKSNRDIGILTEPPLALEVASAATETTRVLSHSIGTETDPEPIISTRSVLIETDSVFHIKGQDVLTQTETQSHSIHHKEIQVEPPRIDLRSTSQMTEPQSSPETLTSSTQTLHVLQKHQETCTIQRPYTSESVQTAKLESKSLGVDTSDLNRMMNRCQRLVLPDDPNNFSDLHDPYIQCLSEKLKMIA